MTDDMQSSFGIVDDGSTAKTTQKVQQFDDAINQTEDSVDSLTGSLAGLESQATDSFDQTFNAVKAAQNASKQSALPPQPGGGGGAGGGGRGFANASRQLTQLAGNAEVAGVRVGDLGNSVSQLASGAGPAAVGTAALAIAVKLYQSFLDEGINSYNNYIDAQKELNSVIQQGSDVAAARVEQAKREIEADKQTLAIHEEAIAAGKSNSEKVVDAGKALFPVLIAVDELTTTAYETAQQGATATRESIAANEELVAGLEEEFGPALEVSTAEVERSAAALVQLGEQEKKLRETRKQSLDDLRFDRARRDSRAAEDEAEADANRADQRAEAAAQRSTQSADAARKDAANLAKIGADGAAQYAKTLKAANDATNKTIFDSNQARVKLQQEFMDKAIDDQNRFNERRAQAENDFANAQFDAIQENDIIGALRAQRAFDQQEAQDQAAADKETQQRETERSKRLQELRSEQAQRIAEIRSNLAIEIAAQKEALQSRLRDQATASAERQQQEMKADMDRARQEAKADKAEAKSRAKRKRRQAEDDELADKRSKRAFNQQLKAIDDKRQAEQQALRAVFQTLQQSGEATVRVIGEATTIVINATGQVVQQYVTGLSNAANSRGSRIPHLAEGGIVKRPTLALIGESGPEAVVPLNSAGGAGVGGQPVNIYLTTADIATGEGVARAIQGGMGQMAQVNIQVLADGLAGVVQ